ncbi:MAG: hypothetical protein D6797_02605 [Bdellovibrio sp.]|nr:MAG: hypothetical protein D6797_02605 [Bdellovibrio sp.]
MFETTPVLSDEKEELAISSILSDKHMSILTSVMRGYNLSQRISEEDVVETAESYSTCPSAFVRTMRMKIATFQVKSSTWDSQRSVRLRRKFREKEDPYLTKLQVIKPLSVQDFRIFGTSILRTKTMSDDFLGFWAAATRKARTKKRPSQVSVLVREFKKDGAVFFALAKGHGKENLLGDRIIDAIAAKVRDVKSAVNIEEFVDSLGNEIFPNTASLVLGLRKEGATHILSYGDTYIYSIDGQLLHIGDEETRVSSNLQVVNGRRGKRMIRIGPLKGHSKIVENPFYVSTAPIEQRPPLPKNVLTKELAKDDNGVLAIFS